MPISMITPATIVAILGLVLSFLGLFSNLALHLAYLGGTTIGGRTAFDLVTFSILPAGFLWLALMVHYSYVHRAQFGRFDPGRELRAFANPLSQYPIAVRLFYYCVTFYAFANIAVQFTSDRRVAMNIEFPTNWVHKSIPGLLLPCFLFLLLTFLRFLRNRSS
jgi:hypothetical protein